MKKSGYKWTRVQLENHSPFSFAPKQTIIMNALIVLSSVVAAASAGIIAAPYSAGLPYAAGYHPYVYNGAPLAQSVPVTYQNQLGNIQYNAAPVVAAPLAAVSSQYQSQDEFGNINYGYANINSAKQEVGNAYGGVTGSYSYVDANGIPQRVDYIADNLGYRVKATNLPVAPVHALNSPVYEGVAPEPVEDTPEVAEAKAQFFEAFEEAKNREKRSVIGSPYAALPYALPYGAPQAYGYASTTLHPAGPYAAGPYAAGPYAAAYGQPLAYAAPATVGVSAPAVRKAVLTTVQLNPGHAVAYKVE